MSSVQQELQAFDQIQETSEAGCRKPTGFPRIPALARTFLVELCQSVQHQDLQFAYETIPAIEDIPQGGAD